MVVVYTLLTIGIIFLATLENLWPSVSGFMTTPQGFVFLGTVHHPWDYFYYLSQYAQGSSRYFTAIDLYTAEPIVSSFVGWSNVLLGRLFFLTGLTPIFSYHISLGALTIGTLLAAYVLCRESLQKPLGTLTAFFLFWLFHAFPVIREGMSSYGDYWNNYAVPRVRLGGVPHQLLTGIMSILIVYFVIHLLKKQQLNRSMFIGLALTSFILASLQPVLWVLITVSIIATLVIHQIPDGKKIIQALKNAAPVIATLLFSGLAPLFYLVRLFQSLPFSQLKAWEATQQTPLTPEHFLTATGPIFLIALFSVPLALSRRIFAHYFMVIFTAISLVLFLSPLPSVIGITHVRFMSTLTILGLSILAGIGIHSWLSAPSRWAKIFGIFLLIVLGAITLPNHIKTLRLVSAFTPTNTSQYLPERDYSLLVKAGASSRPDDVFLVTAPYDTLFPALAARKTYFGHPLLTINAAQKQAQSWDFFTQSMEPQTRYDFVRANNISWIIMAKSQGASATAHWMKLISESDTLQLYRVLK